MNQFFYLPHKARAVIEALNRNSFSSQNREPEGFEHLAEEEWFHTGDWKIFLAFDIDDATDPHWTSQIYVLYKPTDDLWVLTAEGMIEAQYIDWAVKLIEESQSLIPKGQLSLPLAF